MELKVFKAAWGMTGTWEEKLKQIAEAGYDGVEGPLLGIEDDDRFNELLQRYNLDLLAHVYTGAEDNEKPYPDSSEEHIASFEKQVERAAKFRPISICSHSAKDSMPYEEQLSFFEQAIRIEKQYEIPVGHETHRGRATFTPWTTARLLKDLPDLRIVADFSHWCNVCESFLPDQEDNLKIAYRHAVHIHGRIGYDQGPQVSDFRAPDYEYALKKHEQWWDQIIAHHLLVGRPYLTFTPEFGPPPYMFTQPYTRQPVVDLWEICFAMAQRFRERFEKYLNEMGKENGKYF